MQNRDGPIGFTPPPQGRIGSIVLVLAGFGTVGALLWPFLPALVLAAVLATLAHPLYGRVLRRVGRPGVAALITTVGMLVVLLIPLFLVAVLVGTQAVTGIRALQESGLALGQAGDGVAELLGRLAERVGINPTLVAPLIAGQLERAESAIAGGTLGFLSGLGGWLLQLGVAVFTLFYLLRDGTELVAGLRRSIPLEPDRVDRLLARARDVTQATVFGNVLVAMVQGALGGIAFALVGLPAATLWGTIMGVMALIPMVGPAIVWIPGAAYLALSGFVPRAIALAAMGVLVIGTIDNVLRALFVGGRARVHSLVVFLSVLGGLFVFGAVGVVAGPVLFVLALLAIEMGRLVAEPAERRPPVTLSVPDGVEAEPPKQ